MDFFKFIGALFGSIAILGSLCSWAYEKAFLWYINENKIQVPLTLTDIRDSFIHWPASVYLILSVMAGFFLITRRIEKGKTNEEIVRSSPNPKFTGKFRSLSDKLFDWLIIFICLMIVISGQINLGSNAIMLAFMFTYLWSVVIGPWFFDSPLIILRTPIYVSLCVIFIPALLILFFFLGIDSANKVINTEHTEYQKIKINDSSTPAYEVRQLEKGKIIKTSQGTVFWCDENNKNCLNMANNPKKVYKGFTCTYWNFCFPKRLE